MRRLYTRIYWHFILVLVVVALLMGGVFATDWRGRMLRDYAERLVVHAASLMAPTMSSPERRERLARHFSEEFGLDVTVRDGQWRALVVVGAELPPPSADEAPLAQASVHHFKRPHGWYAVAPIRDAQSGAFLGILETTRSRRIGGGDLLRPAATVALLLLIVALATAPLARRISRPVERLTEASRRFGDGDLGYRVAAPSGRWRRHRMRRANDELGELTRAWNEMAERIEKLVRGHRELLANVSHELRSPLQRIRVALELLPEDLAPSVVGRLSDVKLDLSELEKLIDDVLTTSRLEAAGLPTRIDRVDVAALLGLLAERARLDPQTAGKEVRVDGAAPPAIELYADGALIKRALWNLIENAAKYGAPPIALGAEVRGERVAFTVTDEGAGIAPGERERVLEPFYRADKARTPGAAAGGFGLGLTLARRIAEVHGGSIRVEPARADQGCRVTVEIPLRAAT